MFGRLIASLPPLTVLGRHQGLIQGASYKFNGPSNFYDWLNTSVLQVSAVSWFRWHAVIPLQH